jgi:hypothetical protein
MKSVKYALILAASLAVTPAFAAKKKEDVVEMSGISIIGNRELPKTLFIVPWKNSEVGVETELTNTLNEGMQPLDREVFERELDYYDSTKPQ